MKNIYKFLAVTTLSASLLGPTTFAQDHHDDHGAKDDHHADQGHFVQHPEWKKGARMNKADWARGQHIDYRQYHLNAPPRGYEWRSVDGNYVLAAVATGVVASVVVASTIH